SRRPRLGCRERTDGEATDRSRRSVALRARLNEGIEEDRVRVVRDLSELALHALDDARGDLPGLLEPRSAGEEELGPVGDELGALPRRPVVEVDRAHLGRDLPVADGLQ